MFDIPDILYHGTQTHFDKFTLSNHGKHSFVGPGVYLSTNYNDAKDYYANPKSGDSKNKYWVAEDHVKNTLHDYSYHDYSTIYQLSHELAFPHHPVVYHCSIDIRNPAFLVHEGREGKNIPLNIYSEDDFEDSPESIILHDALRDLYCKVKLDNFENTYSNLVFDDEISIWQLYHFCSMHGYQFEFGYGQLFNYLISLLGYDAIIMRKAVDFFPGMYREYMSDNPDETIDHVIVLNPERVTITDFDLVSEFEYATEL